MGVRTRKDECLDQAREGLDQTIRALAEIVGDPEMWKLEPGQTSFPTDRREYINALVVLTGLRNDV